MLDYLRKHHGISPQSIYNDLQGYIKHQTRHHEAYKHLRGGLFCTIEAYFAGSTDKYDEAIRHYDKAIALHPEFAQSYRERGVTYSNKGDFERAVGDLTKAIELNPDFIVSYTERGFNRIRTGDYDGAISDYNWVIEHDNLTKLMAIATSVMPIVEKEILIAHSKNVTKRLTSALLIITHIKYAVVFTTTEKSMKRLSKILPKQ